MTILTPKIINILPAKSFCGRSPRGVFFLKHGYFENVGAVELEAQRMLDHHPKKCLVLSEGLCKYTKPENLYIDRFVGENGIEAADPIVTPYTAEIAIATNEIREIAALAVLVDDSEFIYGVDLTDITEEELQEWIEIRLKVLAECFDIEVQDLIKGLEELEELRLKDESRFNEKVKLFSIIRQKLVHESNLQSKVKLEDILGYRKQPCVLAISGIEHKEVFLDD